MSFSEREKDTKGAGKDSIVIPDDWKHITKPGPHDVLCGRGGGTNNHQGNVKFRKNINEFKLRYLAVSKVEKPKIAREVVRLWRNLDPPGRFLARKDDSRRGPGSVKAEGNVWYDIGDRKAREKASQCLRERTPDVLPFVREMQRRQDLLTGQALSMVEQEMRLRNIDQQVTLESRANEFNQQTENPMNNAGMNFYPSVTAAAARKMTKPNINIAFSVKNFLSHGFQNVPTSNLDISDRLALEQISQDTLLFPPGILGKTSSQAQVFSGVREGSLEPLPLNSNGLVSHFKPDTVKSTFPCRQRENRIIGRGKSLEEHIALYSETKLSSKSSSCDSFDTTKRKRNNKKGRIKTMDVSGKDQLSNHTGRSIRTHLSGNTNMSALSGITQQSNKSGLSNISQHSAMSATTLFSGMTGTSRQSQMSIVDGSLSVMSDFTALTDLSRTLETIDLNGDGSSRS
mmetsp:Transcript_868/g.1059  ORF Transcript_868/g.1059 Transcript_868/m.1059 type:complete len:457 (-) Transcript_868:2280-3650(-)